MSQNTGLLEDMQCPKCGAFKEFRISITAEAYVRDDGIILTVEEEWHTNSSIVCIVCNHAGVVGDFYIGNCP